MSKIAIIGSGFSGLSAAAYLSADGHDVHVFEKNTLVGGRARQFSTKDGYVFDMGPSWYWMPGVFERFFGDFGHKPQDFYELKRLDPAYDIVFEKGNTFHVPDNFDELCALFEKLETGAAEKLKRFMDEAEYKYETGMNKLVYKPGLSLSEFIDPDLIKGVFKLQVFSSFSKHVASFFKHPWLVALMEFPVLFLGATPQDTPALYSLMNYAGLKLGTWYPKGGFGSVISGMQKVAESKGAKFHFNAEVERIDIADNTAKRIVVKGVSQEFDAIVASADYHHVETKLLPKAYRNYNESYWDKKTLAPSCLIFYLGINEKIEGLNHHTLFFDEDLGQHADEIYKNPRWPNKPLFYVCCPSKSDDGVAPKGHENLFLLMPLAPGLQDGEEMREKYFKIMMARLESQVDQAIEPHIDYKKSYCVDDFVGDYHSYKGNAYGLANTLSQTAILKPKILNTKINNLVYAGQLTVPGPGVPPSIISGKLAADQINKLLKRQR